MIGVKFIFRVLMFVASAGLICLLLILVWYAISRFIRVTWDIIERSNSDFAVWLKSKFRNNAAIPWRCRRGWHKWGKWEIVSDKSVAANMAQALGSKPIQERRCIGCNMIERM